MKRLLSLLITAAIIFVACISVSAAGYNEYGVFVTDSGLELIDYEVSFGNDAKDYMFLNEFKKQYINKNSMIDSFEYDEKFYHYNDDMEVDWALVYAKTNCVEPLIVYAEFGNRVFAQYNADVPFTFGYGVYDVSENKFYDLCYVWKSSKYYNLQEEFLNLKEGKLIGDMNNDNELTIVDATLQQKCLAGIDSFSENDEIRNRYSGAIAYNVMARDKIKYLSDYNRDDMRTVDDSTAIQRDIAEL